MYSAEISRRNPTCFVFLIDQSGSMDEPFGGSSTTQKAGFVADAINKVLQNLVIVCAKPEVRDYFWVSVIGYGGNVSSAFGGALSNRDIVPISEVANNPLRVEERRKKEPDGAGGVVEVSVKFPIWFEPKADGGTPMCAALGQAFSIVQRWVTDYPDSFPPVVLNLTDGASTDGDPTPIAKQIQSKATSDGNVLLFNLHVSSGNMDPVRFPSSPNYLPADQFAPLLFELSSPLTPYMLRQAANAGYTVQEGSRGFVFNAGIQEVVDFLEIGTRPASPESLR